MTDNRLTTVDSTGLRIGKTIYLCHTCMGNGCDPIGSEHVCGMCGGHPYRDEPFSTGPVDTFVVESVTYEK